MFQLYFLKWRCVPLLILMLGASVLYAQQNNTPFEQVFVTTGLNKESLKTDFPHLYQVVKNKDYKTEDLNSFIKANGTEWQNFTNLPAVKKLNIAWGTLGLVVPENKPVFQHSFYQWYKASGISEAKKRPCFLTFRYPT